MKKYVQAAANVSNIKQLNGEEIFDIIEKYFTDMFGVNGDTSSGGYWTDTYAAIRDNDIIIIEDNDPPYFSIYKNCAKYAEELFSIDSYEESQEFEASHPDATLEETDSIYDILYGGVV